jgi:exosortase/archaeosortase family protein
MNSFILNVEVACSGLKLLLALTAFTVFFVLIARLKMWANVIAIALIPVFALLVNGLRIALIGVVGETWGSDAGMKFHDYSGYITLIVCFVVLFKIFRLMGWKD